MLSRSVHVFVICAAGPLEYWVFSRPIKIKNKYYIVYNNSI